MEYERFEGKQKKHFKGNFVDPEFYHEIVFSKRMLTDHMPNLYETALLAYAKNP
jgi:hypothetical protein